MKHAPRIVLSGAILALSLAFLGRALKPETSAGCAACAWSLEERGLSAFGVRALQFLNALRHSRIINAEDTVRLGLLINPRSDAAVVHDAASKAPSSEFRALRCLALATAADLLDSGRWLGNADPCAILSHIGSVARSGDEHAPCAVTALSRVVNSESAFRADAVQHLWSLADGGRADVACRAAEALAGASEGGVHGR